MNTARITKRTVILSLLTFSYLTVLGFVAYIALNNLTDTRISYFEQLSEALLPMIGGVGSLAWTKSRKSKNSILGSSVLYFSIGLLAWSFGQFIWTAHNFILGIDVPFPSLADTGYILTPIFWLMGIRLLPKITGVKYKLRTVWGKTVAILISATVLIATFYLVFYKFYQGAFFTGENNLALILNIYYPLSDVVLLASALIIILLSWKTLGGSLKKPIIFILSSIVFMYIADMEFAYYSLNGIYHNGNWVDTLFASALFLLGFGINSISLPSFDPKNILRPLECEDIFAQLALKIIKEEEKLIGPKAWELAMNVPGLFVDSNHILKVEGNKNETINQLIAQFEQIFGNASRELARDAIKNLSTIANTLSIDMMVTLNISSVVFFIRHTSTGNFYSIFPFNQTKFDIDRRHPIIYYLLNHQNLISNSSIPQLVETAHTIAEANDLKEISEEIKKYKAEIIGGIYSDDDLIGLLMIGSKSSNEKFSQRDLVFISQLLKSSTKELAQVIHYRDTQASVLRMKPS